MRGGWARALAGALSAAALGLGVPSTPAAADEPDAGAQPSAMTSYLCSSEEVTCAVQAAAAREGQTLAITVTGRPFAVVQVQVFRLELTGDTVDAMTALSDAGVDVSLDARGYGSADYPMAAFTDGQGAGWALVSLADATWEDPDQIVGTFIPLRARSPLVLGDGYGQDKPVGTTLDLTFANFIPGTEFDVQYQRADGTWQSVLVGEVVRQEEDQTVGSVSYQVPNGLDPQPYRFRLHNLTDTGSIDPEWLVTPAVTAFEQPRRELFDGPALGAALSSAQSVEPYRSPVPAQALSMAVVIGGLVVLLVWPGRVIAARRPGAGAP